MVLLLKKKKKIISVTTITSSTDEVERTRIDLIIYTITRASQDPMAKMLPLGHLHVAKILMGLQCIKKVLGREIGLLFSVLCQYYIS